MNRTGKRIVFFILLAIMIGGVLPWGLVRLGNMFFAANPSQARTMWIIAQFTSLYDRDVIYFDIGNSYYQERTFDAAAESYKSADAVANPKNLCQIRYNWGLALRDKGDQATDRNTARGIYSEALRVISINACQDDPVYAANFERLYAELLARLKATTEEPKQSESGDGDSKEAEETAKDDSKEKTSSKDYQNQRRYDTSRGPGGSPPAKFDFIW